jgi:hypothetical protein
MLSAMMVILRSGLALPLGWLGVDRRMRRRAVRRNDLLFCVDSRVNDGLAIKRCWDPKPVSEHSL